MIVNPVSTTPKNQHEGCPGRLRCSILYFTRRWRERSPEVGTRCRAVVMSFAPVHLAAGLGRTTARNQVVGALKRSVSKWSLITIQKKQSKEVHDKVHHLHIMRQNPADYRHHLLEEDEDASSRHISLCTENKALQPRRRCVGKRVLGGKTVQSETNPKKEVYTKGGNCP